MGNYLSLVSSEYLAMLPYPPCVGPPHIPSRRPPSKNPVETTDDVVSHNTLSKKNTELSEKIKVLEEELKVLKEEKEDFDYKIKHKSRRIEEQNRQINEYRTSRCTFKFPESSKSHDEYVSSYNGKVFKTRVPVDVNYDSWYTLELPYSPLPSLQINNRREKVIIVHDLHYRDRTFHLTKRDNENDDDFKERFKQTEKVIFGIANIIERVDRIIRRLDSHHSYINRLKGEINLYIDQLSEKFNDDSKNEEKETDVDEYGETPYSHSETRTIMETIVKKLELLDVNKISKWNCREILQEFEDELFKYQLELHESNSEATKTMIANFKSKKDELGFYLYNYAETKSIVYTTYGNITTFSDNNNVCYYKNYSVSLPEGRLMGCSFGNLKPDIKLVPCPHDTETDINKKKFHFVVKKKQIYLPDGGCACGCDSNEWEICEMPHDMCCECNSSS